MSKKTRTKLNISGSVWILVLLLALLVAVSSALLGSFIKRYAAGEKNVIGVMVDAGAVRDQYDDSDLPVGALPGFAQENGGEEGQWSSETSVDLFKDTYVDAEGNVTVQSSNGDKIIAPGTMNSYDFTIKNTGNVSLDYTLSIEGAFEFLDRQLPFFVRLRCGEEWIAGNEHQWIQVNELGDLTSEHTLPRGESDVYVFEWKWPYETDKETDELLGAVNDALLSSDQNDTQLGNISNISPDFRLNISTTATVTPGALASFNDGTPVLTELIFVCVMAALLIACILLLVLYIVNRRVYLAAFITPSLRSRTKLDDKEAEIDGKHVVYPKVRFGAHLFEVYDNSCKFKLKRGKVERGVLFEEEDGVMTVTVDRSIRALELHFKRHFHGARVATIEPDLWAAIDRRHNVYTPMGMIPADPATKTNCTPDGLSVDEHGKFDVR